MRGKPDCNEIGVHKFSACSKELYCSTLCNKEDWKIHKIICPLMKNDKDDQRKKKVFKGTNNEIRLLGFFFTFAEHQYGKNYRERGGDRLDAWNTEICCLYRLCDSLALA